MLIYIDACHHLINEVPLENIPLSPLVDLGGTNWFLCATRTTQEPV
jgi:hypothetical protein